MKNGKTDKGAGISIRVVHAAMLVLGLLLIVLLVFMSIRSSTVFARLNKETGNYIVRQKAAHDLMEASDYLTEMVQRFTLEGETEYMDDYFEEAFSNKRREASITTMAENDADQTLVDQVQAALNESNRLMFREYYAMKLVVDAKEIRTYPDTLRGVELKTEDMNLAPEAKMDLAQKMVMGTEYYAEKSVIRNNLKASLLTLDKMMTTAREETTAQLNSELSLIRIFIIIVGVLLLLIIGLSANLGTIPLIRAAKCAKNGKAIPVVGAKELRYLAESYNQLTGAKEETEDDD